MKRMLLILAGAILLQSPCHAQFNAGFAPANWTYVDLRGTNSMDDSNAPSAIHFTSTGNVANGYSLCFYYITAPATGTLSVDWSIIDPNGQGQIVVNVNTAGGPVYQGTGATSGTFTSPVTAGDHIEFDTYIWSNDPAHSATATFSNFSAPGNTPLPIELKSFTGTPLAKGARLEWETAAESKVASFSIERSLDSRSFTEAGNVIAKNVAGTYTFTDQVLDGKIYYRLRVNNIGGAPDYSNVISVHTKGSEVNLSAYPNPATDGVTVHANNAAGDATASLINVEGKVLDIQRIANNQAYFNLSGLPAGMYTIRVNNSTGVHIIRIVKQ